MSDQQLAEQALVRSLESTFGELPVSMIELLKVVAHEAGDQPAIMEPDRESLSYAGLMDLVERTVRILNGMGLDRRSRVALVLPTAPDTATVYLSVMMAMTALALPPNATIEEYDRLLKHTTVDAVIVQRGVPTAARDAAQQLGIPLIEIEPLANGPAGRFEIVGAGPVPDAPARYAEPEDKLLVITTSGTTSLPKFVYWTHRSVVIAVYTFLTPFLKTAGPRMNMLPLHHGAGVNSIFSAIAARKGYVCLRSHSAAHIYRHLALYQPESIYVVPAILRTLVAAAPSHQAELAQLRIKLVFAGSAVLSEELLTSVQQIFGAAVNIGYGLSETGPVANLLITPDDNTRYKAGSVGKPIPLCQVRICDENGVPLQAGEEGEINILSPLTLPGYENNPEANAEQFRAGWFRSGDTGYLDADGYLYLTGRVKEVINRGGSKIAPLEVEEVLLQHSSVAEAATFGFPHSVLGEDVAAAVVRRDPALTERELRLFVSERLPFNKVPSRIVFVDALPKTALGKLRRRTLAEQFSAELQR